MSFLELMLCMFLWDGVVKTQMVVISNKELYWPRNIIARGTFKISEWLSGISFGVFVIYILVVLPWTKLLFYGVSIGIIVEVLHVMIFSRLYKNNKWMYLWSIAFSLLGTSVLVHVFHWKLFYQPLMEFRQYWSGLF